MLVWVVGARWRFCGGPVREGVGYPAGPGSARRAVSSVVRTLAWLVTVIDQEIRCRSKVLISFYDQNPESARTVKLPAAPARRTIPANSSTNRLIQRDEPAEPLRIRESKICPVSARVASSG